MEPTARVTDTVKIRLNATVSDRLQTLALEYSLSEELLINAAVKKLLDDVALLRDLRAGNVKLE
jgi:predicted transcriptional regulator